MDEEQNLCLSRIKKSADRLKNLIDDVLLVVGAKTRTLKAKMNSFELAKLEIPMLPEIAQLLNQKNISLKVEFSDVKALGDPHLLTQVFQRLIHNAAKFGQEKSVILLKAEVSAPHRLKFSIVNLGTGISDQVIEKILKPFFIDEDVMNHSVGMGLGLTVCQAILKAHGSSLRIENTGTGVSVSFELPFL